MLLGGMRGQGGNIGLGPLAQNPMSPTCDLKSPYAKRLTSRKVRTGSIPGAMIAIISCHVVLEFRQCWIAREAVPTLHPYIS